LLSPRDLDETVTIMSDSRVYGGRAAREINSQLDKLDFDLQYLKKFQPIGRSPSARRAHSKRSRRKSKESEEEEVK